MLLLAHFLKGSRKVANMTRQPGCHVRCLCSGNGRLISFLLCDQSLEILKVVSEPAYESCINISGESSLSQVESALIASIIDKVGHDLG